MAEGVIPTIERIEPVHPEVARALRAKSGMERLRLAHETWELVRDRLAAYLAAQSGVRRRFSGTLPAGCCVTQAELLRYLVEVLETLGVEYMIGGSQTSMYYGEPRLTRDVDVVVGLRLEDLPAFLGRFPADELCVDEKAARGAVQTSGQFNIIHPGSGLKIDVYVNPDTPYDRTRLARRQKLPLFPEVDGYFARPEDVILYKLLYYRQGESALHLRDGGRRREVVVTVGA